MWLASLRCSAMTIVLITTASILDGCSPSLRVIPPLTNQPADTSPAWSPDGNWIAYAHFAPDPSDTSGLFVVDTTGSGRRLLAIGFPGSIDWSPDSRSIVYN